MFKYITYYGLHFSADEFGEESTENRVASLTESGPGRSVRTNVYTQRNGVGSVPRSLRPLLKAAFDNPSIWWIGKAIGFLTRPNQQLESLIEETKTNIGFKSPIAG